MHTRHQAMERVDDDESKLFEVRKHPIGIILLYVQASIGMILASGLAYFLLPLVVTDTDFAFFIANVFTAVSVLITFAVVLIATLIYRESRLIVTDRNITQVLQYGLFNRKVSQLNLQNVEDVTAVTDGFLPTSFNYGTLKVETAGEQVNFNFPFCPSAGYYAKVILDARERMLGQAEGVLIASNTDIRNQAVEPSKTAADTIKDLGAETVKQAAVHKQTIGRE